MKTLRKFYKQLDENDKTWAHHLNEALIKLHTELNKLGYKIENDYTPDYEASDEEWSKYDIIASDLEKKFKIVELNSKYSKIQNQISNQIWDNLKILVNTEPKLAPYKELIVDENKKFKTVNRLKKVFIPNK